MKFLAEAPHNHLLRHRDQTEDAAPVGGIAEAASKEAVRKVSPLGGEQRRKAGVLADRFN